eukprot:6201941-Pleurochrysis_carterae.AAC.1
MSELTVSPAVFATGSYVCRRMHGVAVGSKTIAARNFAMSAHAWGASRVHIAAAVAGLPHVGD